MLNLEQYKVFSSDILNKGNTIYPIIILDWDIENDNIKTGITTGSSSICISTVKDFIAYSDDPETQEALNTIYLPDMDLKINARNESIDVENNKFKIGNVSVKLNNFSNYMDERLSDYLSDNQLINKYVYLQFFIFQFFSVFSQRMCLLYHFQPEHYRSHQNTRTQKNLLILLQVSN